MSKDPEVFLAHILESIDLIEDYSEGKFPGQLRRGAKFLWTYVIS